MTSSKDKSVGLLWVTCLSLAVLALLAYVCTAPDTQQMVKVPCEGTARDCVKNAQQQASTDKARAEYKADKQISRLTETKAQLLSQAALHSDASSVRKVAAKKAAAKQLLKAKAAASRAEKSMGKPTSDNDLATTVPTVTDTAVKPSMQSTPLVNGIKQAVANVKKKATAVFKGVSKGHSASDINHDEEEFIPNEPQVVPMNHLGQNQDNPTTIVTQDTASTLKHFNRETASTPTRRAPRTVLRAKVHRVATAQSEAHEDNAKAYARIKAKLTQELTEQQVNHDAEEDSSKELAASIAEGRALLEELHEIKDEDEANEDDEDDDDELYARDQEDTKGD